MQRKLSRRSVLANAGAGALAWILAGCGSSDGLGGSARQSHDDAAQSSTLVGDGVERRSPSGRYIAAYEDASDKKTFQPVILDVDRREVWRDQRTHTFRFGAGVFWKSDADVLVIQSHDLGDAVVEQTGGVWTLREGH